MTELVAGPFLGGRLQLRQPAAGHRVGTDAVLLQAAAPADPGRVADFGCGVGAVGLSVLARAPSASCLFVDIEADLVALARDNALLNGLADRCCFHAVDLTAKGTSRRAAGLASNSVDLVLANPPFAEPGRGRHSRDARRTLAHVMPTGGLQSWVRAAADMLRPGGDLMMIHRADALPRLLEAMAGRFGAIVAKPVHARQEAPALRILVRGRKGSRGGFSLAPGLVLHASANGFTAEAEALHRGEAGLVW